MFTRYIIRKLALTLVGVFCIVVLDFVLFRALPGSYISDIAKVPNGSPALQRALAAQFGLDKPKLVQFWIYLKQLARGNLGVSFVNQQPVLSNLETDLGNTLPMVGLGTLLAMVLGTATGIVGAWLRGEKVDHAVSGLAITFYALPPQWIGLMLIMLFGGLLPVFGAHSPFLFGVSAWGRFVDYLRHMILPSSTIALALFGQYTLIVRSALAETLSEDYVLTARAKGLTARRILWRHALPNAMLPTATLMALSLGYVVGGSVLIETVFSWPGIGLAIYNSVVERDYPMLQGAFLLITLSVVTLNFIADLLYFKLDPRVRTA